MSPKKKRKKKSKPTAEDHARTVWFHEADDGTRPGLEFLNGMPRDPRETLYAMITAFRDRAPGSISTSAPLWSVLEGRGAIDTSGIYEAREMNAGTLFRLFCVVDPVAEGEPALVVLSGDTRPVGRELPVAVIRRVRAEAVRHLRTSRRPGNEQRRKAAPRTDNPFEVALARELEDPYFRAGFERKLARMRATDELVRSLELARANKHLTKAEVARRINRRPEAISRLLAGKDQSPSLDTITDLAYALGLEIELRIRKRPRRGRNVDAH
jgi:helix-turn-helix protein